MCALPKDSPAASTCLRRSWEFQRISVGCAWVKTKTPWTFGALDMPHGEAGTALPAGQPQLLREKPEGSPSTSPSCWSVQPGRSGHPVPRGHSLMDQSHSRAALLPVKCILDAPWVM